MVYCYLDAGSWERFRKFPSYVLGNVYAGYPDERWLDIRRLDVIGPIMDARMDSCKNKGFDGVQFDNVDAYGDSTTGLNITQHDDLMFSIWLANEAHRCRLGAAFEHALENASAVQPYTEWGISRTARLSRATARRALSPRPQASCSGMLNTARRSQRSAR